MMVETGYGAVLGASNVPEGINATSGTTQCYYNVQVFPSKVMEDRFMTTTPMFFSISLASIFCFTSLVFLLYDWCVARRHHKVQSSAVKSGAVVRSLFPEKVVERLYESTDKNNTSITMNAFQKESRNMLLQNGELGLEPSQQTYGDITSSDPIADLYPECTVLFADIAGFTKWSANRQPADVFRLLETLYSAFDKAANNLRVFKVETVGDCYVAVTGLPHRQPNHAVRMVRFAAECMVQMNQVLHKMVPVLGPETATLSMRAGLHSGPVTAGILRGDKARFQLFGDTVNTAARMESTSQAGMIQISEATAVLLMKRGKSNWLRLREDVVAPKGKGAMTTYWVEPKGLDSGATESMMSSEDTRPSEVAESPRTVGSSKHRDEAPRVRGSTHPTIVE
jgi:class 3 adenylate cyclase